MRQVRLLPIKWNARIDHVGDANGQLIYHPTAEAEPDDTHFAGGAIVRLEPLGGGQEVLGHFFAVTFGLHGAAFIIVAGVATQRSQGVRRQGQKSVDGQASRDVGDIRIQATVFVDHQHGGELAVTGRVGQQPLHLPCPVWRRVGNRLRLDPGIIRLNLFGPGIVGCEVRDQGLDGQATHGERGHASEVFAAVDAAVSKIVIELQHSGIEVLGLFAFHE